MSAKHSALSTACAALVAALSLAGAPACGNKPSEGDCDKVVRHIIDLEATESGAAAAAASQKAEVEQRKKAVFNSLGTARTYCRDEMSMDQVRCALGAKTMAELSSKCEKS